MGSSNSSSDSLDIYLPKFTVGLSHINSAVVPSTSISHRSAYNIKSATLPFTSQTTLLQTF